MNKRNIPLIITTVVVWAFMLGAAAMSFHHIVSLSERLGLGWEAWTVPFFIDGIAAVGKVSRLDRFEVTTQRSGLRLMFFGGLLSLAANVTVGENWGQRGFGVLLVVGFVILENHATKLKGAPPAEPVVRKLDPEVAAERARKAAATREANRLAKLTPAQKAAETRKQRSTAPTSPGHGPVPNAPSAAQVAELVG